MKPEIPKGLAIVIIAIVLVGAVGLAYYMSPSDAATDSARLAREVANTAMRETGRTFEPLSKDEAAGDAIMMGGGGGGGNSGAAPKTDETRKKFRAK